MAASSGWRPLVPDGDIYARQRDRLHFSAAVRAGDLLIVSGVIGNDESGRPVADPSLQIDRAFENLSRLLEGCGARLSDVAKLLSFHVDFERRIGDFVAAKDRSFVAPPYPAWTAIGVASLAFGALVEIRAIAAPLAWQSAPR